MNGNLRHLKEKLNPFSFTGESLDTNTKDKHVAVVAFESIKVMSTFGVALEDREDFLDDESSVRRISL